ncbi:hypothetical protein MGH68_04875 [Erysipelothrix sp. D19-032]
MSTQYSGPRVGVPLDGFDALLVNLNWMVGLNRNLNFDVEAEMVTRHIRRPVHLETLNDSVYYAMTLQDEDIPSVIRKEGNTFRKQMPHKKLSVLIWIILQTLLMTISAILVLRQFLLK